MSLLRCLVAYTNSVDTGNISSTNCHWSSHSRKHWSDFLDTFHHWERHWLANIAIVNFVTWNNSSSTTWKHPKAGNWNNSHKEKTEKLSQKWLAWCISFCQGEIKLTCICFLGFLCDTIDFCLSIKGCVAIALCLKWPTQRLVVVRTCCIAGTSSAVFMALWSLCAAHISLSHPMSLNRSLPTTKTATRKGTSLMRHKDSFLETRTGNHTKLG